MKQYAVLDPSLSQVSQGDTVYPIVGGLVTMPAETARDLVLSGQITLASNVETKAQSPEPVEDTKPGVDETTDEGAGEDDETDGGEEGE